MKSIKDISVGDKVVIVSGYHPRSIDTVKRLTKTQIILIISESRFRRCDGDLIGGDCCNSTSIAIASGKLVEQVGNERLKKRLCFHIKNTNWNELSLKRLEEIINLIRIDNQ